MINIYLYHRGDSIGNNAFDMDRNFGNFSNTIFASRPTWSVLPAGACWPMSKEGRPRLGCRRRFRPSLEHSCNIEIDLLFEEDIWIFAFWIVSGGESAPVAQWIEQWIPNPCAACSIHAGGTSRLKRIKWKMKGWRLLWKKQWKLASSL